MAIGVSRRNYLFLHWSSSWHAICNVCPAMRKIAMSESHVGSEPSPQFATDAEVAFAQWLRHQLEQRYLGHSTSGAERAPNSGEMH